MITGRRRYYERLAAAFVRGRLQRPGTAGEESDAAVIEAGLAAGLRLHKFKADGPPLPRVVKVLGILRGLQPESVADTGSGRGAFLWPLLDQFPELRVIAMDRSEQRARDLAAVRAGGVDRLSVARLDATRLGLAGGATDVVTILEVLEHLKHPELAAQEALRVARRAVIATVPSKPDDNPEHIQLFTAASLTRLLRDAGARTVKLDGVLNHLVAVAMK